MSYILGIILAIGAGTAINIGQVLQKKAVNEIPADQRNKDFMKTLIHNRTWLLGLLVQVGLGTTMVIIAQIFIGPALLPGLLAAGLIFMAIGAAKIVGEQLNKMEMMGIGLIIVAVVLISLSNLAVDITEVNLIEPGFLSRQYIFTSVFIAIIIGCEVAQRKLERFRSILFAFESGCFLSLANYWVSPVTGHVLRLFGNKLEIPMELIWGIVGAIILVLVNIFAVSKIQHSFKTGNANVAIPIQQVPVNIAPIFVYFGIFLKTAPSQYAVAFMLIAVGLIIFSSYALARRQVQLDAIK
jgi:hypothetical protein